MSRSFKKHPISCDKKTIGKHYANRNSRRVLNQNNDNISNGCAYKKLYERYDVCDFKEFRTLNEWIDFWHNMGETNMKKIYKDWYKTFKMK